MDATDTQRTTVGNRPTPTTTEGKRLNQSSRRGVTGVPLRRLPQGPGAAPGGTAPTAPTRGRRSARIRHGSHCAGAVRTAAQGGRVVPELDPRGGRPRLQPAGRAPAMAAGPSARVRRRILRLASESPAWDYQRTRGGRLELGHRVSATAIKRVRRRLRRHGVRRRPGRPPAGRPARAAEHAIRPAATPGARPHFAPARHVVRVFGRARIPRPER